MSACATIAKAHPQVGISAASSEAEYLRQGVNKVCILSIFSWIKEVASLCPNKASLCEYERKKIEVGERNEMIEKK